MTSGFNPQSITSVGGATNDGTGNVPIRAANITKTANGNALIGGGGAANLQYGELSFNTLIGAALTANSMVQRAANGQSGMAMESGATASRPPNSLGRMYYDTTLNMAITADGAGNWRNGAGAIV